MTMKKGLVALAGAATLFAGATAASAGVGSDVQGTKYQDPIDKLASLGIATGYEDGTIQPDKTITRAEFAAIVVRELNLGDNFYAADTKFSDVSKDSHWAGGYINVAVGQGILKGYPDGTFKPDAPVTYAEAATMLVRMLGYAPSVDENNWPASYIGKAASIGVTDGVRVSAGDAAIRGDVFMMAANSLDIDIMEQETWGSEQEWTEQDDQNILTEYFDIDIYDGSDEFNDYVTVDNSPRVDLSGLEANEIELDGAGNTTPYEVSPVFDPNQFLGQEVEAWIDEDNDYVYYIAASGDEEVYFDDVYVDGDSLFLDDEDDDYEFSDNPDPSIWINLDSDMDIDDLPDNESDKIDAKVVLNDKDEVVAVVATDYYVDENDNFSGLVTAVDADEEVITYYDEDGTEQDLELDDEDYAVVKDSAQATLADIEADDIINVLGDGDEYYIVATSEKVEGTISSVRADNNDPDIGDFTLYIDDDKYDTVSDVTLSEDDNDSVDSPDVDDIKDLDEQEVTLYLDANGDVRHVVSGELEGSADLVGVVSEFAKYDDYSDEVKLTLVNAEGNELDFEFDPSDVDFNGDEISGDDWVDELGEDSDNLIDGKLLAVEYDLDKNGELNEIELLDVEDAVTVDDSNNDIDEDDDTITFDDSTYNVTDKTVIWDVTNGIEDNEIDDVDVVDWSAVENKDEIDVAYTLDNDEVEYMFVVKSDSGKLTSEGEYGVILDFSVSDGDDAVVLLNGDGDEVTFVDDSGDLDDAEEGDFIRYELDSDDEIDEAQILASSQDEDSMDEFKDDDDLSIDFAKEVVVDSKSGSYIKADGVNYAVGANTVYFDIHDTDELDVVSGVGTGDLVYLVDTDDDGRTVDFVVIVEEDFEGTIDDGDLTVDVDDSTLTVGQTEQLTVEFDGDDVDLDNVDFTSSDKDVITVDEEGLVEAVGEGDATVTVKYDGEVEKINFTVDEVSDDVITGVTANKGDFAGAYLYAVSGDVTDEVDEVIVTIGDEEYTVIPDNGTFELEIALDGDYDSAEIVAKDADGDELDKVAKNF